jgi:O-antigen/teichoic acid export membrane protein
MKSLSLRRNFSWTFIGNAVYAACQWGMLIFLAKLGSPEMVGQFTLGLAISAPVIMFTNLQLRIVQASDAKQQYDFSDYLGLRLLATLIGLIIILGITFSTGYRWETSIVILLVSLAKGFEAISDVFYGLIQQHERMDRIAISLMIKGPLSLILMMTGIWATKSVIGGVFGLSISWALVLFMFDIPSGLLILSSDQNSERNYQVTKDDCLTIKPRWNFKTLVKLFWFCLPLGLVMMLISLNTNIPRYLIEHHLGERELGIFAAISYLMIAGNMVISALGESATPKLAKYYAEANYLAFRSLLLKMMGIAILIGGTAVLISAAFGQEILTALYGSEYGQHANFLVWLMVAAALGYMASFLGYSITAAQYLRIQFPLFTVVTAATAFSCFWLLPKMGLMGATIALVLSSLVQLVLFSGVTIYALQECRNTGTENLTR